MKFYRICSFESDPRRYAWASGYGPVEHMPFLDSFSDEVRNSFSAYWKINNSSPGIKIDRGGRNWSDILGCGGGPPSQFYSERVIEDLRSEGIPFLRATEMSIGRILSKRLRDIPPPRYFVLEAEAGMKIRYENISAEERLAASKSLCGLYCSERVKELAERKGWTNIAFKPVGDD